MIFAIVYGNLGCGKCKLTDRQLTVPHTYKVMSAMDRKHFKDQGIRQAPVVQVYQTEEEFTTTDDLIHDEVKYLSKFNEPVDLVDSWSDFDMSKIKHWNQVYQQDNVVLS